MARIESVALGGYYPTPPHLVPVIRSYLRVTMPPPPLRSYTGDYAHVSVLDPCAGEGDAILGLVRDIPRNRVQFFGVEMEETRAKACKAAAHKQIDYEAASHVLHGDAFRVRFAGRGVGMLYLNPPYDQDRVYKRLEARFLYRFTESLVIGGVLVFVVPHYALESCADHLAQHYRCVRAFRFPTGDLEAYRQCVLFAERRDALMAPDPTIASTVREWARDVGTMRPLADRSSALYDVPVSTDYGDDLKTWELRDVDFKAVLGKYRPWHVTMRGGSVEPISCLMPVGQIRDSLLRFYPVATPPRPAHIATGIAAGIFNGSRIAPNDNRRADLPDLLVKGVFDREFKTVDVRENDRGEVTGEIQVQQPRLVTTILDLSKGTFHRLGDGAEATGATDVSKMNVADLLAAYGNALMDVMAKQCPTLYDPRRDAASIELVASPRSPFSAQAHAARALVKLLRQPDHSAILLGEIGSGKSTTSVLAARTYGAERVLVMCPPHLLQSWRNEAAAVAPDMAVHVLETVEDLDRLPPAPSLTILSRETAKLSHGVEQVRFSCPKCGLSVPDGDLAKKRARCASKHLVARNDVSRGAYALASYLLAYSLSPTIPMVMRGRFDRLRNAKQRRRWQSTDESPDRDPHEVFVAPPDAMLAPALAGVVRSYLKDPDWAKGRTILATCFALDREEWTAYVATALLTSGHWLAVNMARSLMLLLPPLHEAHRYTTETRGAADYALAAHRDHLKELAAGEAVKPYELACEITYDEDDRPLLDGMEAKSLSAYEAALDRLAHVGRWVETPECGEPLFQAIPEPRRVSLAKHIARYHRDAFDFLILDECFVAGTMVSGRPIETIRVGDVVDSYDEVTRRIVKRPVKRLFVSRPSGLVRVRFDDGRSFVCTPGHPVFLAGEWVPAARLRRGDIVLSSVGAETESFVDRDLSTLRDADDSDGSRGDAAAAARMGLLLPTMLGSRELSRECAADVGRGLSLVRRAGTPVGARSGGSTSSGVRVLLDGSCETWEERGGWSGERGSDEADLARPVRAYARFAQPDEQPGFGREDGREEEGMHVHRPGRQRAAHGAAVASGGSIGSTHRGGSADRPGHGPVPVAAAPLQGGHRGCGAEACDRGGWGIAQATEVEVPGPAQGSRPIRARVDSVEVLEPGRDGTFGGVCADGLVYNLEVEGTHTYLAEGVVVHNCHELATDGSAQSNAGHRLAALRLPTVLMTGSIMNGYAVSMFVNTWSVSSDFRREFARDEKQRFIDRFGYRKRIVEDRVDGKVVEYGSQSDRVERCERILGEAPGILPLFVLRHLLPVSVTLHKSDLAIDLPVCHQVRHKVRPTPVQLAEFKRLQEALVAQIKRDLFSPDLSGKLFGQLAELPSYLDRATIDVGNTDRGAYEIRYPESVGGDVVASAEGFPEEEPLPKEAWMLETIEDELATGRNVMVFSWHLGLLPRLARIIEARLREPVVILHADKVPTGKRQAWIDKEVVQKGRRVMVTNPVAIQTGLNNLVHFAAELWMENPACSPAIYRQAMGRIDRIGQTKSTHVHFPVYADTLQETLYELLMRKVAVSISVDGLDPESAMLAAGLGGDGYLAGLSIGRQLWAKLTSGWTDLPGNEPAQRSVLRRAHDAVG